LSYGEKLLTTGNPDVAADRAPFGRRGLRTAGSDACAVMQLASGLRLR
jgi:hypothetical protein